jgi:hypothetical protein
MTTPHRATPEQWEVVKICSEEGKIPWPTADCLLELRARVEALEADQLEQAEIGRLCVDAIVRRVEALEAAYEETAMAELRAASAEARPAASEIFPVEYADANGEGIRIIMEPAEETGQVCWVVRNSRRVCPIREFPTPEAAYAAHQARPTVKESLTDGKPLLERVANAIYNVPHDSAAEARAAIREVAAWIRDNPGPNSAWSAVARDLMDEADRG